MTAIRIDGDLRLERDYNVSTIAPQAPRLAPAGILGDQHLDFFETRFDRSLGTVWCYMRPPGRPVVTQGLLDELGDIQAQLQSAHVAAPPTSPDRFSFFVFGSRIPGVFNMGGDLATFTECVRTGNRDVIHQYARSCVDIVYQNAHAFHLPVVTVALVQGDALGGGFETALSFDVLVAERSAKFCLPEILFNLFPGMGAYSFLSRKLGAGMAERLITEGNMHTAEDLHRIGLVDILAEDGEGEAAVEAYIRKESRRLNARLAINATRRRVNPITHGELRDVVDLWTDAVFRLSDINLRKMDRLVGAQKTRMARS